MCVWRLGREGDKNTVDHRFHSCDRSSNFYHLWAGFENAAFLGYYQVGTNLDDLYTLSWQASENYSCAYNFTNNSWTSALNIPASGLEAEPVPFRGEDGGTSMPSYCREIFAADHATGRMRASVSGAPYDCRKRGWYFNTKANLKKQWTSMYVDKTTGSPAFALCAPLFNLSATASSSLGSGLSLDDAGLIGVACTGLYIEAISAVLLEAFSDITASGPGAFIVERSSGLLVAAGISEVGAYYDSARQVRISASQSSSDHIRFATASAALRTGTISFTTTVWVTAEDEANYPLLKAGDAYYVTAETKSANGISWDLVVLQQVVCPTGYYVDIVNLICGECISPASSSGGAPQSCDRCAQNYVIKSSNSECAYCPVGARCDGKTPEDKMEIKPGYWRKNGDTHKVYECLMSQACSGGNTSGSYCTEGFTGVLCNTCDQTKEYFFDSNARTCVRCEHNKDYFASSAAFVVLIVFLVLLVISVVFAAGVYVMLKRPDTQVTWSPLLDSQIRDLLRRGQALQKKMMHVYDNLVKTKFTVFFVWLQIVVEISANCNIVFPTALQKAFASLSVVNFQFTKFLAIPCWGGSDDG